MAMDVAPFEAHPWLRGGQAQTIAGQWRLGGLQPGAYAALPVPLGDGDSLLLHVNPALVHKDATAEKAPRPIVMLLHGLGGSSASPYILRITAKLNRLGVTVVRFNHRGCGQGAAGMARQIYHAARGSDLAAAVDWVRQRWPDRPLHVAGFSLSGNMLLRYLGEMPDRAAAISRALAVCPPVDLELCSLALSSRPNKLIDRYYTRMMRHTAAQRLRLFPDLAPTRLPRELTLRHFDEIYTAREGGFADRDAYYAAASSKSFLSAIDVPTVLLAAQDDPIIPPESFAGVAMSRSVQFRLESSGGHMGFISRDRLPDGDRRWMDHAVIRWAL